MICCTWATRLIVLASIAGACQERRTQLTRGDGQTAWIMGQIHTRRNGLRLRSRETCETKCTQPAHSRMIAQHTHTTSTLVVQQFRICLFSSSRSALQPSYSGTRGACGANSILASWTCDLLGLRLRGASDPGSDLTTTWPWGKPDGGMEDILHFATMPHKRHSFKREMASSASAFTDTRFFFKALTSVSKDDSLSCRDDTFLCVAESAYE